MMKSIHIISILLLSSTAYFLDAQYNTPKTSDIAAQYNTPKTSDIARKGSIFEGHGPAEIKK
jgi:hypothetical protein